MKARQASTNSIIHYFATLSTEVKLRNRVNLQDINIIAEQFYKILLNDIFGYNLENINIVEQNVASIDLGDKKKKIAIQVTSDNSKKKIKDTVDSFLAKGLNADYDKLKILIIKEKIKRTDTIENNGFKFDMDQDVIDLNYITSKILDIDDLQKLQKIEQWLFDEFAQKLYQSKIESKPNEIETFIKLIDILSDENNHKTFEIEDEPDPEYKIEKRFKDYASHIKTIYTELIIDYSYALNLAEQNNNISSVKIRKIGTYLKDISNTYLKTNGNDPEIALNELCNHFKGYFIKENLKFDEMAIKFYLIHQLIKCNVFPN